MTAREEALEKAVRSLNRRLTELERIIRPCTRGVEDEEFLL